MQVLSDSYMNAMELFYSYREDIQLPLNPNVPENQEMFKSFYQNMVEETAEFLELYFELGESERAKHTDAILDEVADISNFVHVLMGLFRDDLPDFSMNQGIWESAKEEFNGKNYITINHFSASYLISKLNYNFGMTCNLLKNRPWKKSQFFVGRQTLYNRLDKSYNSFKLFILALGISENKLKDAIDRKVNTNKFRIKSNY